MTMQALMVDWFRRAAKQANALGYGNTAAIYTRTATDLARIPPHMFVLPDKLVKAMDMPPHAADALASTAVAEQKAVDETHAANVVEGEKLVVSGPPSTAPAAPAPDSPAVQPPAEVVEAAKAAETPVPEQSVEAMAAKFAAPAPDAKP